MTSHSDLQALLIFCEQLYADGQKPTVGLLRGKAPFKVSVIDAIEAIKRFNQSKGDAPPPKPSVPADPDVAALEKRVKELENAIVVLEKRLDQLQAVKG